MLHSLYYLMTVNRVRPTCVMEADLPVHFKSLVQISFPGLFRVIVSPSRNDPLAHTEFSHMLWLAEANWMFRHYSCSDTGQNVHNNQQAKHLRRTAGCNARYK